MSDDSWHEVRVCVECGGAALCDPQYEGEARCGTCWATFFGVPQAVGTYHVAPPKVANVVGRKKPGRYVKGSYQYWEQPTR